MVFLFAAELTTLIGPEPTMPELNLPSTIFTLLPSTFIESLLSLPITSGPAASTLSS